MIDLKALAQEVLDIFIEEAVKVGDLSRNSNLVRSFSYKIDDESLAIFAADYLRYVEQGRPPGVRKVPMDVLITWVRRLRLQPYPGRTLQSTAFAIQTAIYVRGLRPRPFMESAATKAGRLVNIWLDRAAAQLLDED